MYSILLTAFPFPILLGSSLHQNVAFATKVDTLVDLP